jgi:hypothetical protein
MRRVAVDKSDLPNPPAHHPQRQNVHTRHGN